MILTDEKILEIYLHQEKHKELNTVKDYTDKLLMHIKGVDIDKYIERIAQFEPADLIKTRKKYAVSNKDLFARLMRPLDKVFSAKGGSTYYNLSDSQADQMREYCSNVSYGYSVKKWLQVFWMPARSYDPMGLVFMEVNKEGKTYPTYKSVNDIFTYLPNGLKLEYVFFQNDPRIKKLIDHGKAVKGRTFRIVDDVSDRIVTIDGTTVKEIDGETYLNYYLEVPARIISDIYDPVKGFFVSSIDPLIEIADQFLSQGSIKNIFKNYFGFPQHWTYQSACPECMGTKVLAGTDCSHCKGTGLKQRVDPSETIYLPVPQTKDTPLLAPNVGGFITPDVEGWDKMDGELKLLENTMHQTLWGTHQLEDEKNETATGKFIDVQPVNEKLSCESESAEKMEKFILDCIGTFVFQRRYTGSSVTYGRRYLIETPDELWKKYEDARKNGAPTSALDDLYMDYLQARYAIDSLELQKYTVLSKIEPYKHLLVGDLTTAPSDMRLKKLFYSEWIQTKNDAEILLSKVDALREEFEQYCEERLTAVQENAVKETAANAAAESGAAPGEEGEGDDADPAKKAAKEKTEA